MEEIIHKLKKNLEDLKTEENVEEINSLLEKIEQTPVQKAIQLLKDEQLLDAEENINQYMLKRMIQTGIENKSKLEEFKKQYGKIGTKEERFDYKNKLVMLELPVGNRPLEMHIEKPLPEELMNAEKTRLSVEGTKFVKLAFCDALLKIGREWKSKEQEWGDTDQLVLASFMLNKGTVKFLNELGIGFDGKYIRLEPTNFQEPPKVISTQMSQEEIEEASPYIDRYAIHSDAQGKHIPTKTMGIAKISKNDLTRPENLAKIISKMQELEDEIEQYHDNKRINIASAEEKYGIATISPIIAKETIGEKQKGCTLQEIGQGTIQDFKQHTGDAINCFKEFEKEAESYIQLNEEQIQGEN